MMLMSTSTALVPAPALLGVQASALIAWKASLDYQSQPVLQSWGNTSVPCNWRGIRCGTGVHWGRRHPLISGISLRGMQLRGTLESLNFSALKTLTCLNLSHNHLTRTIPPSIEVLEELNVLLLQGNQIRGSIPLCLANLTKIHSLMLQENKVSGEIPRHICNMTSLVTLNLSYNHLDGNIPSEIGHLNHLVILDFSNNNLSGTIPSNVGDLTKLTTLYL